MKKFGFYAAALAFCVLLVGVVAVSSPIEADAWSTGMPAVDITQGSSYINPTSEQAFFDSMGNIKGRYWSLGENGTATQLTKTPEPGDSYIEVVLSDGKLEITLSNIVSSAEHPFQLMTGNTDVEIELIGNNVLRGSGECPALSTAADSFLGKTANLTITGSGSLTCYGNSGGAAVYAECDLTVTGGAKLYAYADEADADAAGSGNGGTARAGDTTSKHGLFAGGSLTVESGSVVEGVGGKLTDFTGSVDCSDGVHVTGGITVKSGGSLKGTGSEVNGTDGNMFIRGIYSGGSITV